MMPSDNQRNEPHDKTYDTNSEGERIRQEIANERCVFVTDTRRLAGLVLRFVNIFKVILSLKIFLDCKYFWR